MRRGESQAGRFPSCPAWNYWANGGTDGLRGVRGGGRRLDIPPARPYVWRQGDAERAEWAAAMVAAARRRARDRIAGDIEAGAWWVPRGFTVADLDALITETYR